MADVTRTTTHPPRNEIAEYMADRWERNTGLDWHTMPIADDDWDLWVQRREQERAS